MATEKALGDATLHTLHCELIAERQAVKVKDAVSDVAQLDGCAMDHSDSSSGRCPHTK